MKLKLIERVSQVDNELIVACSNVGLLFVLSIENQSSFIFIG